MGARGFLPEFAHIAIAFPARDRRVRPRAARLARSAWAYCRPYKPHEAERDGEPPLLSRANTPHFGDFVS